MKNWKHINNTKKGIVNELSDFINDLENSKKIFLPDLRDSDKLYIFSDYSANRNQKLTTYSILILDEPSVDSFISTQKYFWEDYGLGLKIIDYKNLNYGPVRRALVPFLTLCNKLNGLLFTAIFHKDTKSIFKDDIPEKLKMQMNAWRKNPVREKFLRLREFILLILNGLGRESQNILWISDNDEVFANNPQLEAASLILKELLHKYLDYKIENFELKTLDADSSDKRFEKLCSISDLAAGSLVDFVGDYHNENIFPSAGEIANPIIHAKLKINPIINWLSRAEEESMLKKITIKISEKQDNSLQIEAFRFPQFT
jgi:hypothetical protein